MLIEVGNIFLVLCCAFTAVGVILKQQFWTKGKIGTHPNEKRNDFNEVNTEPHEEKEIQVSQDNTKVTSIHSPCETIVTEDQLQEEEEPSFEEFPPQKHTSTNCKRKTRVRFGRVEEIKLPPWLAMSPFENRYNHRHHICQLRFILRRFFVVMEWKVKCLQNGIIADGEKENFRPVVYRSNSCSIKKTRTPRVCLRRINSSAFRKRDTSMDYMRFEPRFRLANDAKPCEFFSMNSLEELYVIRDEVDARLEELYRMKECRIRSGGDLLRILQAKHLPENMFIQTYEQWFNSNISHFVDAARVRFIPDSELMNIDMEAMVSGYERRSSSLANLSSFCERHHQQQPADAKTNPLWSCGQFCLWKHKDFMITSDGTWTFPIIQIAKNVVAQEMTKDDQWFWNAKETSEQQGCT